MGRYSNDPIQNAEMAAEHAAEMRMTGVRSYWNESPPEDEPGADYGPEYDEDENEDDGQPSEADEWRDYDPDC